MEVATVICPECKSPMVLRETTKYLDRKGHPSKFYGCSTFPECKATHGAHSDGRPFGKPGDKATKEARIAAHAAFDELWKDGYMVRTEAYVWLQEAMSLSKSKCHIGMFDVDQCNQVVEVVEDFWRSIAHDAS